MTPKHTPRLIMRTLTYPQFGNSTFYSYIYHCTFVLYKITPTKIKVIYIEKTSRVHFPNAFIKTNINIYIINHKPTT